MKSPLTQPTEPQRINLEEYRDWSQDQEASTVSTTKPQEDWDQDWAMEEGDADTMDDEEVEEWEEGGTAGEALETGVTDITWDLEDPISSLLMRIPA